MPAQRDVQTVGALGSGGMTEGVLGAGDIPPSLLDEAARSARGEGSNASQVIKRLRPAFRQCYGAALQKDPNLAGRIELTVAVGTDGKVTNVTEDQGLPLIGPCLKKVVKGAVFAPSAKGNAVIKVPLNFVRQDDPKDKGSAFVGGAGVSGGSVSNAARVVARFRGRFRACYNKGLETHPTMQGAVVLVAKIDAQGAVTGVGGSSVPLQPILGCLKAVVASGGFAPPDNGAGATISVPVTLALNPPSKR